MKLQRSTYIGSLKDACLDVFSEQKMGLFVMVLEKDGTSSVEEVYIETFLQAPSPGITCKGYVMQHYQII